MEFFLPGLVSFLVTILATFPTLILAKKYNLMDNPNLRPHPAHVQNRIIPRAGGLPIFLGITLSLILFLPLQKSILGIIVSLAILLIVGLADDKYHNLSPYKRLFAQILSALLAVASGVGINFITNPLGGIIYLNKIVFSFQFLNFHQIVLIADLLAIIWLVWVMNMVNWSKGVDGQMPGIAFISTLILGFLSLKLGAGQDLQQLDIAKIAFICAGAALGLLIWNWHPAKILPGFSGSTILGFLIATLAILSGAKLATAGLVLLVPATDFIYIFLRRIIQGKSPVWGDRGHLHHHLLNLGLSHQKISLFYILGSVILGSIALSLDSKGKLFAALLVGILVFGAILWLNFFGGLSKHQDPDSG